MYEIIVISLTFFLMLAGLAIVIAAPFAYVICAFEKRKALLHIYAPSFTVLNKLK